jgi:hypothetical protein
VLAETTRWPMSSSSNPARVRRTQIQLSFHISRLGQNLQIITPTTRCDQQSSRARDTRKFFARAVSHMGCKADDVDFHWRPGQRCWWLQD